MSAGEAHLESDGTSGLLQSAGDKTADERARLFATLYADLHRIAQRELRRNSAATLSPTTLLHETYLNLSQNQSADFSDRAQFLGYAARAMRGLLIDYLRMRQARKRGGGFEITSLGAEHAPADQETEAVQIGVALESLAQIDARLAECVDLKFFCGFTNAEIAELWKVSERTVVREWDKARVLLRQIISETSPQATP